MRNQYRNKRSSYIACRDLEKGCGDNGKYSYSTPFLFKENISTLNGSSEIEEYGNRIKKMYKSVVQKSKWLGEIKEFDVAYLEGAFPDGETINGIKANYRVESVRDTSLNTLTIYFEKLP